MLHALFRCCLKPPELATIIRRLESYSFDDHAGLRIMDCRNGSIFTKHPEGTVLTHVVHRPLCPQRSVDIVPPLPSFQDNGGQSYAAILSKDEGSGLSYWYVLWESTKEAGKSTTRVYMLQDGVWLLLTSATCLHGVHFCLDAQLIDNKIYMMAASGDEIIIFDFTDSPFSTIQLPQGVNYHLFKGMLSRADDASSVYLIHVKDFQLRVWLRKGDKWLLVDTIRLHEMLAILGMPEHTVEDEDIANAQIIEVGDNAQFVFLRMCQCIFYLDIKCRTLCKVYQNTPNDRVFSSVHPFMMIWPPTFPTLKDDPTRDAM